MTEHSAVIFVFFFLAEYASIVLMCILTSLLFLGGYLYDNNYISYIIQNLNSYVNVSGFLSYPLIQGLLSGISIGLKSSIMIFTFI